MADLVLDRDVRDWVLIPLTLVIFLMMLLRQYATSVFFSSPPAAKPALKELREQQAIARAQLLRQNHGFIPEAAFRQRRAYFVAKDTGFFSKKPEAKPAHEQMMGNPDMMTGMLKQSAGGIIPQIAMGAFVSFFFSGFIMGKIPFPLSPSFRLMLQRGVDLPSLDVTYFTSLSYYILLLFGFRGVFTLLFREGVIDEAQAMRAQMGGGMGGPPGMGAPDPQKAFDAERSAFDLIEYKSRLEGVEAAALATMQQQLRALPKRFR